MRDLCKTLLAVPLLCLALSAEAKLEIPSLSDLPVLTDETVHRRACTRTANYFLRAHYKAVEVNDEFVDNVIDSYLYFIDFNRSLYTADEVKTIHANRDKIKRAIDYCDLSYPYELYNEGLKKRFEKYGNLERLLNNAKEDVLAFLRNVKCPELSGDTVEKGARDIEVYIRGIVTNYSKLKECIGNYEIES